MAWFMNHAKSFMIADRTSNSIQFQKKDASQVLRWGMVGFAVFGAYNMSSTILRRQIDPSGELVDECGSLHNDPTLCKLLIDLQHYRSLNPWLFSTAILNIDTLILLENGLVTGYIDPARNDKVIAFTHYKVAVDRLNMLLYEIKTKLGNDHGLLAHNLINDIYKNLRKRFLNILHLCSQYNPQSLIRRAEDEIRIINDNKELDHINHTEYGEHTTEDIQIQY